MQHFYETIPGYFDFAELYRSQIDRVRALDNACHYSPLNPVRFVEVGCWLGRSAAYMATEILSTGKYIEFYIVDTFDGVGIDRNIVPPDQFIYLRKPGQLFKQVLHNLGPVLSNPDIYLLPKASVEAAKQFTDCSFDFVFIDAAHDYDSVFSDLKAWYPKMKPNGILAGHDFDAKLHPGVHDAVTYFFSSSHSKFERVNTFIGEFAGHPGGMCWYVELDNPEKNNPCNF